MRTAPQSVRNSAKQALRWLAQGYRCCTPVGLARAKQLAGGRHVSDEDIVKMCSYFARHAVDRRPGWTSPPTPGAVAWYAWGGDAGRKWACAERAKMRGVRRNPTSSDVIWALEPHRAYVAYGSDVALLMRAVIEAGFRMTMAAFASVVAVSERDKKARLLFDDRLGGPPVLVFGSPHHRFNEQDRLSLQVDGIDMFGDMAEIDINGSWGHNTAHAGRTSQGGARFNPRKTQPAVIWDFFLRDRYPGVAERAYLIRIDPTPSARKRGTRRTGYRPAHVLEHYAGTWSFFSSQAHRASDGWWYSGSGRGAITWSALLVSSPPAPSSLDPEELRQYPVSEYMIMMEMFEDMQRRLALAGRR